MEMQPHQLCLKTLFVSVCCLSTSLAAQRLLFYLQKVTCKVSLVSYFYVLHVSNSTQPFLWVRVKVSESTTVLSTWVNFHQMPLWSRKLTVDSTWRKTLTAENDLYPGTKYVQGSTRTSSQTVWTSNVSSQVKIKNDCVFSSLKCTACGCCLSVTEWSRVRHLFTSKWWRIITLTFLHYHRVHC